MLQAELPLGYSKITPVPGVPNPGCWSANGKVIFSAGSGETQNIWQMGVSPITGKVSGPIERLTIGSGNEVDPSCATGDAVAFTNVEVAENVWSLPFNANGGIVNGSLERITEGPATQLNPSLSTDGRYLTYLSDRAGPGNVWVRELSTGKEMSVATSSLVQGFPVINSSGDRIAFSVYDKDNRVVYVATPGGTPEKMCEGCLRATDWSRDGKNLLVFGGDPYEISILDVRSRERIALLRHPTYNILYARFSPDNRWVSFTARIDSNRGRIAIAPIDGSRPVPESAWITIQDVEAEDYANWSPDGKTLYFTSAIDGHKCLWGQRLDSSSRRPAGPVFPVQHIHGLDFRNGGWSAGGGRIALALVETTGNIWMLSHPGSGGAAAPR